MDPTFGGSGCSAQSNCTANTISGGYSQFYCGYPTLNLPTSSTSTTSPPPSSTTSPNIGTGEFVYLEQYTSSDCRTSSFFGATIVPLNQCTSLPSEILYTFTEGQLYESQTCNSQIGQQVYVNQCTPGAGKYIIYKLQNGIASYTQNMQFMGKKNFLCSLFLFTSLN
jgi:hypothetical protein